MTGESISPIDNFGYNFGPYFDPMSYAMCSGYGNYGMTNPMLGYSSSMMMNDPTMGMYGGSFMQSQMEALKEYYKFQEDLEKQKLEHTTEMHRKQQLAEVTNLNAHEQKFLMEVMSDGYVQNGIRDIYDEIRQGHSDSVVRKFYELKQEILNKYCNYFNTPEGNINLASNLNEYINRMYSLIGKNFQNGIEPDLRTDIRAFCENSFQHGWNKYWFFNHGHNELNAEQTLNQIFGTGINDIGSKKKAEYIGGLGSSAATGALAGGGAVIGVSTVAKGLFSSFPFKNSLKATKWAAILAAAYNIYRTGAWDWRTGS